MSAIPPPGPEKPPPWWRRKRFGGSFLFVSIALHLLFGAGATIYVVQRIQAKRVLAFQGGPPNPSRSQRQVEHRVQVAKQKQTSSAPAPPKRVAVTGLARVSLPEMPSVPVANTAASVTKLAGMGGAGGFGAGPGTLGSGAGTGGSGGGGVPAFGLRETTGGGLRGTFYDLKQTPDGKPTEMNANDDPAPGGKFIVDSPASLAYDRLTGQFIKGGMNEGLLGRFFRGPAALFTTQIFIPTMGADQGPQAFNLSDRVKPKRWIVVYRGVVTPPEGGNFRFVGWGDDVLAVRLNNRVVLEGSLCNPSGLRPRTEYHYQGVSFPLFAGDPVNVAAGISYPMEIVIGERPGGDFNAFLLLEKVGEPYAKSGSGSPVLPIFKLARSGPPAKAGAAPETAADTAWSVWKGTFAGPAAGASLLDQMRKN